MRACFLFLIVLLAAYGCQKELSLPPLLNDSPAWVKVTGDTFFIRAFYGHQGLVPPKVGTVIFPQPAYEVPAKNKLAFMSAYTGYNGYGDSAGTVKKNALNDYNGEFYNTDVNALPNARIIIIPINRPATESSSVSADSSFAYTKFFKTSRQVCISITLVNGMWEHQDTSANGKITVYQMNPLLLVATESVETGLATLKGVQKLVGGQSEFYMAFVNQRGYILQPPKQPGSKAIAWYPHLNSK